MKSNYYLVNRKRRHCLTAAVLWTFLPELSLALVPRLAYSAFSLVQPYLIHAMITYITLHSRLPDNFGYGLIGAYALNNTKQTKSVSASSGSNLCPCG